MSRSGRSHVFISRADLTRLACDAWLLPATDLDGLRVGERWLQSAPWLARHFENGRFVQQVEGRSGPRVWRLATEGDRGRPQAYLVNTGGYGSETLDRYLEVIGEFFRRVAADLRRRKRRSPRERPLVALPMPGTRRRGPRLRRGAIIDTILRELYAWADQFDVDIALVTLHDSDFSAAQWARRRLTSQRDPWGALARRAVAGVADRLAAQARSGRLVLFLGAGVSAGAGLPTWEELLWQLGRLAGFRTPAQAAMLERLPAIDRADLISRLLEERGSSLAAEVATTMRSDRYSLSDAMIASLPVNEFVTTNYDELFETACIAIGNPVAQLPYHPDRDRGRWLLKLHGTVARTDDIVLTRDDYLAYHDRRAALSGIVQGLLITKHMFFVGFSLTDDTFQRIAHDVRKAIDPRAAGSHAGEFGTAVLLEEDELRQRLWAGDIAFVAPGGPAGDRAASARAVEIFLDRILAEATTNNQHLLDPTYDDLLDESERQLRDGLSDFLNRMAGTTAARAPAWQEIERMATRLGRRRASDDG